jgi:hypothetical protein
MSAALFSRLSGRGQHGGGRGAEKCPKGLPAGAREDGDAAWTARGGGGN